MAGIGPIVALVVALCYIGEVRSAQYLGKFIGKLSELHHGVSGEVYAVDGRTLHIKDFTYDGQGPAAYFYASTQKGADRNGFRLRDENGNGQVIRRYRKEGITLTLPEGKTLNNIKIFYVWCEDFDVNFGDVKIPRSFDYPRPQKIDALNGVHSISSDNIVIVDAQTLLVPNLSYDGEAPDAKFWVGRGSKPSPQGIRVPDENGKEVPLRRYDRKTVVLTLPGDLTIFDIGHFGIWCEKFTVDFGHVLIPQGLNIPPSLKMLGVSPQKRQQVDISSEVSHSRPRVGGHLPPTTFRPPSLFSFFTRRNDPQQQQHDLVHRAVASQPMQNALQFVPAQQVYHQHQVLPHLIQQVSQQQVVQQPQILQNHLAQLTQQSLTQPQLIQQQLTQSQLIQPQLGQQQLIQQQLNQQQLSQPQQIIHQQQPQALQRQFFTTLRQPVPYTPINLDQRQYHEQLAYQQYLQNKRLQEEQLQAQLARQHNRFDLSGGQNTYFHFG